MNIREFTIADYEAAHSLWWNTKGVCNCEKCMKLDSRGNLEKYMARNPNTCFIAEADGKLVGTILAGHDGRTGIIYRLTVDEDYRKMNIGRALVERSTEALKREGIPVVTAFVLKENDGGNVFWEKLGFEEEDRATTRRLKLEEY